MSRHDPRISLLQMRDHAREAVALCRGRSRADLDQHRLLNLAVTRLLEIVGEAAARVPDQERAKHPQIAWSKIVGLRNRLTHAYDAVNLNIVWGILTEDLPDLLAELDKVLEEEET